MEYKLSRLYTPALLPHPSVCASASSLQKRDKFLLFLVYFTLHGHSTGLQGKKEMLVTRNKLTTSVHKGSIHQRTRRLGVFASSCLETIEQLHQVPRHGCFVALN